MEKTKRPRGGNATKDRLRFLAKFPVCQDCLDKGKLRKADEVHHVIALTHGGLDTDENKRALCKPCHLVRTAEQFGYKKPRRPIGKDGWPIDD